VSTTPIADYALLSDRHSAALVSRDGSIDWLCFPRFDSPSIFGRLLGGEAGHWSIRATSATQVTRRYLDRTMVLETTFRTPTGTVTITDALAMGEGNRGHELGQGHRIFCCAARRALTEKSSCPWSTSRAPSTGWSIPCSMLSPVA
jgi:alpha,alpha-trehalase